MMDKLTEISEERGTIDKNHQENLVVKIDENERIINFNKKSEILSGYSRTEVINKKILGFLIPKRYEYQWTRLIDISKDNKIVDNIKLPLLTKNGHEIMLSWISFPVKNEQGGIGDINLIGNLIKSWTDNNEFSIKEKVNPEHSYSQSNIGKNVENHKVLLQLQEMNNELIEKNYLLEEKLKTLEKSVYLNSSGDIKTDQDSGHLFRKGLYSLSEVFGSKKRKQEFHRLMTDLEERVNLLNEKESDIIKEKHMMNERIIEFKKWREKLESLENDIENRHKHLNLQEKALLDEITGVKRVDVKKDIENDLEDSYDIFDRISDSAVVIQRGIIKKANDSFSNLLGYNYDEIVDKSLFDFICSEGFYDVEKYYLNRLKGEDVSFYNTVFLTKDNSKISVEISPKPTFIDGDMAEIAIVKKIDNEKQKED